MIHPGRSVLLSCSISVIFQVARCQIEILAGSQVSSSSDGPITSHQVESEKESNDIWSMAASMATNWQASVDSTGRHNLDGFEWQLKLDDNDKYRLDWTVRYFANEIAFAININQQKSGFRPGRDIFALGFSQYGDLQSSDFCLFWYDLSYQLHLQDAMTDASGRLKLIESSQSQCKLSSTSGQDSKSSNEAQWAEASRLATTRFLFTRPLDICGQKADYLPYYGIDNGTTHLLWFTLTGPVLSIDGLNLVQLSSMSKARAKGASNSPGASYLDWGLRRAQLVATKAAVSGTTRAGKMSFDMTMNKFKIPAQETTYWCKLFKLAHKFEQRRYHMTKYEALIEPGNEHIVHHMELFNCANLDTEDRRALDGLMAAGWQGDCNGPERPKATKSCRRVIAAWAMGAHPLEYPEQVGQSIGGHNYSPYLMLEVHYNNIHSTGSLNDSSGLRFHYASRLRKYDAGILEVGLEYTDKNSIPPNLVTPLAGYCVSECTRTAISSSNSADKDGEAELKDGIYIFAGQLHTHLAGVASWTELIREGQLIREIQRDNHYSPHFQEIRLLPEPVHVAPGDAMIHYCLYDTRKRTNITLGGYATSDEMCVTYLHYYPRTELEVCKSSVDSKALEAYFAYLASEEGQPTSSRLLELQSEDAADNTIAENHQAASKSVTQNYCSIEWTRRRSRELVQFYSRAPLSVQCNRSDGRRFAGHWNGVTPTRILNDLAGPNPMESRLPSSEQLLSYRGRDQFAGIHAHCAHRAAPQLSTAEL